MSEMTHEIYRVKTISCNTNRNILFIFIVIISKLFLKFLPILFPYSQIFIPIFLNFPKNFP